MGPWGALIMGFFGGVFFVAATCIATGWKNPYLPIPLLIYAAIAFTAWRLLRNASPGAYTPDDRTSRVVSRATMAEGIGIPIVSTVLGVSGHPAFILPGIAAVVGLHFLPMGYFIPFRPFAIIAWLLFLAAATGAAVRQPDGAILAGLAAAFALWAASAFALTRKPANTA